MFLIFFLISQTCITKHLMSIPYFPPFSPCPTCVHPTVALPGEQEPLRLRAQGAVGLLRNPAGLVLGGRPNGLG